MDEKGWSTYQKELSSIKLSVHVLFYFIAIGRSKFLQFCTGAGSIPPIGLTKPTITVTLNSESNGIYASTCLQTLCLPKFASRDDFTLALNMSIFDETFNAT